jgi:hypothetical protein
MGMVIARRNRRDFVSAALLKLAALFQSSKSGFCRFVID